MRLLKLLALSGVLLIVAAALWIFHFPNVTTLGDSRRTYAFELPDRAGKRHTHFLGPNTPDWCPLRQVSPALRTCVVASEDDRFFTHHGFDLRELRESLKINIRKGGYVRGASTITMQLARNLFLSGEKTIQRKASEALLTLWLEGTLEKDRILELYLNVVEWGSGIRGIGGASRRYYAKRPSALTWGESAYLAVMLPNPHHYNPRSRPVTLRARQRRLVERLIREKRIPPAFRGEARNAPKPRALLKQD